MRTFAQKQNQPQKPESSSLARPNMATLGPDHREHPILHLQRTIGNQAVLRMLQTHAEEPDIGWTAAASPRFGHDFSRIPIHPPAAGVIQTKLAINKPGDEYEQEADRISQQVMRLPEPQLQRACACGGTCHNCQTEQSNQVHERVQTKRVQASDTGQIAAPPIVHEVLAAPGQPLDLATRGFMEPRFGHDFSRVRVHADSGAAGSAESIHARAYTVGHHVVFGAGKYRPGTADGRRLLAHELAHVAQQDAWAPLRWTVVQRDDTEQQEDPKVTALKAELVATFGFSAVTDPTQAKWTVPQLEKMKRALARIPAAERSAIKGVELRRVVKTTHFGSTSSGLFHPEIVPGTGIRQDRIEIPNDAFDNDVDSDAGGAHTTFGGQIVQGAPSEGDLTHEVGHALEGIAHRQAEEARVKAGISDTAAFNTLEKARKAYNDAILTRIDVPAWHNQMEKNYLNAIVDAQKKLNAITTVMDKISETTAAESKKGAADVKGALDPARTAIAARNAARRALPRNSTYALPTEEAAQDAWMAAAVAVVPPFEARAKAQETAGKAQDAEDATQITVKVSSGQKVQMTRRLAEFVAVIEVNKIDIPNSGLGNHVTSHWPNNPEEAYAELYNLSLTAPEGLRKFDKKSAMATYFTSPVGLKGAQKAQAASWLASHK